MHAFYLLESLNLFASSDLAKKSFDDTRAAARTRAAFALTCKVQRSKFLQHQLELLFNFESLLGSRADGESSNHQVDDGAIGSRTETALRESERPGGDSS